MAHPEVEPTSHATGLLHADEDRLRLAAATLARGGRFVLVVATNPVWASAARFLRELLPAHRFVEHAPTSSDETNRAISDPLRDQPGQTIVLRIDGRDAGPIETLNLRRESLVKAAANFMVVLEGDAAHGRFLREAPDCYSYRDLLVVLQGEPTLEAVEHEEEEDRLLDLLIERAQQEADPRVRASQLSSLAWRLKQNHRRRRADELYDEAITAMTAPGNELLLDDEDRALLAQLYAESASGRSGASFYWRIRKARDVLAPVADQHFELFAKIEGAMNDAIGPDLEVGLDALRRAREGRGGSVSWWLLNLAAAYYVRGNLIRMREVLAEVDGADPTIISYPTPWILRRCSLLVGAGAWVEANQLASSTESAKLKAPKQREVIDIFQALLLMWQGEGRAAQRICEQLQDSPTNRLLLIRLTAESGRVHDAITQLEPLLEGSWSEDDLDFEDPMAPYRLLSVLTEQEIAAGGPARAREALDARLAALRLHIERTEDPDPPWDMIQCLLLQSDAYLKRTGAEQLALSCAEQAWQLACAQASVLASGIARRAVIALLRLGDHDQAHAWLSRGLAYARKHEHRRDEAELAGLALWQTTLAGGAAGGAGALDRAELDMQAAITATGSRLVEASVLLRVGSALARRDLLQRAQQIYRSLPWPAREGACLEAMGEAQVAAARYRAFGLTLQSTILARRSEPPPITAVNDD